MSIIEVALSPLAFILVGFFAVSVGLLASYIKDMVGEGKKGLLVLWAELSYFVSLISFILLLTMPWTEGMLPLWSLAPVLLYVCVGLAFQYIYQAYDPRIKKHQVNSNGAMIGLLLIWQTLKWPLWIKKSINS